jgi:hypothetical protein
MCVVGKLRRRRIRNVRIAKPISQPCQEDQIAFLRLIAEQVRHFCQGDGAYWSQAFRSTAIVCCIDEFYEMWLGEVLTSRV